MNRLLPALAALCLIAPAMAGAEPAPAATAAAEPTKVAVTQGGLVADFYLPAGATRRRLPAIIVLGGSEGGLSPAAGKEARLLAIHGYAVMQLAYFDAPGLPKELGLIPLEYFRTAIDWLAAQPSVDPARIGVEGTSIGGEVALVVASHDARIKAVVAAVPSNVVWPGISHTSRNPPSTFTLAGRPLPDLPYGWSGSFTSIYDLYAKGLLAVDQHPDAIIPVEAINGPVMLICGEKDTLWPSCPMSDQVAARLKAKGFRRQVVLLKYPDAGHAAFGAPVDPASPNIASLASVGGSVEGNQAARLGDWPRSVAFMDTALKRHGR